MANTKNRLIESVFLCLVFKAEFFLLDVDSCDWFIDLSNEGLSNADISSGCLFGLLLRLLYKRGKGGLG